ncbi:DUF397 domain-containing protein [Streptomyces johnsoniae]|uniref:DUF397 domain-containing protein n=1 Tax=Streptomyces johnsoniae TaxID=3075532 RepID=A0ABU2RXI9_9ACTN|nr:DUF397 domain-containing protein [Streptomyces sp. DSM 41886]MDT0441452.1 DUF397 domain-containing protein [Streptomyces sp. DSM 41886]
MSTPPALSAFEWVKSSYSNPDGGACVEWAPGVAAVTGVVPVRDSKVTDGPTLAVSPDAWEALVRHVGR